MTVDEDLHTIMSTVDDTREHISEGQYLRTCEAISRIHVKLKAHKLPLPSFDVRQCIYVFSYAVSVIKIIEKVTKIVSK
jgi:hypothetical protein